ncbi:MAG: glycosyltransferase [Firmicutes bacterium]|nr:glycosyltransferase [Bacillota bacterium]MCM1400495.1 glycosyltransferase [Bacteroides sp.]MCM1476877.1 glycosyltransferase [Bacteroides sp.]
MNDKSLKAGEPLVSVVMIAFNVRPYIDDAIQGVVNQKLDGAVELIVQDDCSTDGTWERILHWQSLYPRLVKPQRNRCNLGLQRNYMEAFSRCRGRYVAVCDSDDYWFHPRKLAIQTTYMEAHPLCAITFHRVVNYYQASGEKSLSNGGTPTHTTIENLSRSNYITNLSVMYRRELVDLQNLPEWIASDRSPDYALHMLYASHGYLHYFSRPMGVYRKAQGSSWSMTDNFNRQKMAMEVRLRLMEQFALMPRVVEGLRAALAAILRSMASEAANDSQRELVSSCARQLDIDLSVPIMLKAPSAVMMLLKATRRLVSKMVPLPRP